MFVIGETKGTVSLSKLCLPKEYHLRRKKIYGLWVGERFLYLSDEHAVLKGKIEQDGTIFEPGIDTSSRIEVPYRLNNAEAIIRGCISFIEIEFQI